MLNLEDLDPYYVNIDVFQELNAISLLIVFFFPNISNES